MRHHHLVFEDKLLRILRVFGDVRLGIVFDQLELFTEQAAFSIDLLDGKLSSDDSRLARNVERAGAVEQATDRHLAGRPGAADLQDRRDPVIPPAVAARPAEAERVRKLRLLRSISVTPCQFDQRASAPERNGAWNRL